MPRQKTVDPRVNRLGDISRSIQPPAVRGQLPPTAPVEQAVPAGQTSAGRLVNFLALSSPALAALQKHKAEKEMEAGEAFALAKMIDDETKLVGEFDASQSVAFQDGMSKLAGQAAAIKMRNAALAEWEQNKDAYASGEADINALHQKFFTLEGIENKVFKKAAMPLLMRAAADLNAKHREASSEFALAKRDKDAFTLLSAVIQDPGANSNHIVGAYDNLHDNYGVSRKRSMELSMTELKVAATQGKPHLFEKFIKQAEVYKRGVASSPVHRDEFYALYEQAKRVRDSNKTKTDQKAKWDAFKYLEDEYNSKSLPIPVRVLDAYVDNGILTASEARGQWTQNVELIKKRNTHQALVNAYSSGDAAVIARAKNLEGADDKMAARAYDQAVLAQLVTPQGELKTGEDLAAGTRRIYQMYVGAGEVPAGLKARLMVPQVSNRDQLIQQVEVYQNLKRMGGGSMVELLKLPESTQAFYDNYSSAMNGGANHTEARTDAENRQNPQRVEAIRAQMGKRSSEDGQALYNSINLPEPGIGPWERTGNAQSQAFARDAIWKKMEAYVGAGKGVAEAKTDAENWFAKTHIVAGDTYIDVSAINMTPDDAEDAIRVGLHRVAEEYILPEGELSVMVTPVARQAGMVVIMHNGYPLPDRNTGRHLAFDLRKLGKELRSKKSQDFADKVERAIVERRERRDAYDAWETSDPTAGM